MPGSFGGDQQYPDIPTEQPHGSQEARELNAGTEKRGWYGLSEPYFISPLAFAICIATHGHEAVFMSGKQRAVTPMESPQALKTHLLTPSFLS